MKGAIKKEELAKKIMNSFIQRQFVNALNPTGETIPKFVSYKDIKKLMADLKLVYASPTGESTREELELLRICRIPNILRYIDHSMITGQPCPFISSIRKRSGV